ncbi:MAG: HAD family hydrolase [Minisyncoccia bacterium]
MNIDWIFFDIGGVLADESEFLTVRQNYNLETIQYFQPETTMEDVLKVWPQASEMLGDLDENVIQISLKDKSRIPEAIELMNEKRNKAPNYYDLLKIRPEAIEVIPQLAKKYKLGIMANQNIQAREKLGEIGLLPYFQNTDVSIDHKLSKPDPEFFKKIFEITKADPNKSIMVDDNIERGLAPSKKLGMTTILYKLDDSNPSRDVIDFSINSLKDLLKNNIRIIY